MAGKKGNRPGDVVLVHLDDRPAGYARVEDVRAHARPGWFECDLLFLAEPPQPVTWVLEREQIDGTPFTMGGRPVRIGGLPALGEVHANSRELASSQEDSGEAVPEPAGETSAKGQGREKRNEKVVRLVPKPPR